MKNSINKTMKEKLADAGFYPSMHQYKRPYRAYTDFNLPFGYFIGTDVTKHNTNKRIVAYVNNIRQSAKQFTPYELAALPIVHDKEGCSQMIYEFLMNHIEKVKRVEKKVTKPDNSQGQAALKREYYASHQFGNLVFYFEYDKMTLSLYLHFNYKLLSKQYDTYKDKYDYLSDSENVTLCERTDVLLHQFIEPIISELEFIPLYINEYNPLLISHHAFKGADGVVVPAVCMPCYGMYIKEDEEILSLLCEWLHNGGNIIDDHRYLICQKSDTGTLYLRRYNEKLDCTKQKSRHRSNKR